MFYLQKSTETKYITFFITNLDFDSLTKESIVRVRKLSNLKANLATLKHIFVALFYTHNHTTV